MQSVKTDCTVRNFLNFYLICHWNVNECIWKSACEQLPNKSSWIHLIPHKEMNYVEQLFWLSLNIVNIHLIAIPISVDWIYNYCGLIVDAKYIGTHRTMPRTNEKKAPFVLDGFASSNCPNRSSGNELKYWWIDIILKAFFIILHIKLKKQTHPMGFVELFHKFMDTTEWKFKCDLICVEQHYSLSCLYREKLRKKLQEQVLKLEFSGQPDDMYVKWKAK